MKTIFNTLCFAGIACSSQAWAQEPTYTNFIRQIQYPSEVIWDMSVEAVGEPRQSHLAIDPGGARFELWTVSSEGPTNYLLAATYVGTYVPLATVAIRTEDNTSVIPRTRADRPFFVDYTVSGLLSGEDDPEASKSVKFLHHVQSYGVKGTGVGIDRTQATLSSQSFIESNGAQTLSFAVNTVPNADRSKVRGEERFSFFSLEDYQAPESQIASQFVQIWPVADGTIAGITSNQLIRYTMPQLTLTMNDLYPNSTTYAQIYKGGAGLGKTGTVIPGSALVVNDSVPQDRVLVVSNYDSVVTADGTWTIELLTKTPFGIDRLGYVTFQVDRTIDMNGSFTTIE